jgi:hypothetical protein
MALGPAGLGLGFFTRMAAEVAIDAAVTSAVEVIRGGNFGDSFKRNLIASFIGNMVGEAAGLLFEGVFRAAKHAAFGIDFDLPSTWSQGLRRSVDFDLDANLRQFDADINLRGMDLDPSLRGLDADVNLRGAEVDPYTAMRRSMDADGRVRTVRRGDAEAGASLRKIRSWYADYDGPRARHYTNRRGLKGIQETGVIRASERQWESGCVFCEQISGRHRRPMSPQRAEEYYLLHPGRGRDYVEFDTAPGELIRVQNPVSGRSEWIIRGNVNLARRNPKYVKRR